MTIYTGELKEALISFTIKELLGSTLRFFKGVLTSMMTLGLQQLISWRILGSALKTSNKRHMKRKKDNSRQKF